MKEKFKNSILILASVVFAFLCAELGYRIIKGEWRWTSFWDDDTSLIRSAYPTQFDAHLGWIPKEGFSGEQNVWGTTVTILPGGIRSNGIDYSLRITKPGVVLAIGDSYTFGDAVSDSETWPAFLERKLKKRVLNAGVFGYGLDQSYLRAYALIQQFQPETLIFSFIPDDVARCELSERTGVKKPYYEVGEKALDLKNFPIEDPFPERESSQMRQLVGYSYLAHSVMRKLFPNFWIQDGWGATRVHKKGAMVSCGLLNMLGQLVKENNIKKAIVLIQYEPMTEIKSAKAQAIWQRYKAAVYDQMEFLKGCIQNSEVKVVDLKDTLEPLWANERSTYQSYFADKHMTAEGNKMVAELLADTL